MESENTSSLHPVIITDDTIREMASHGNNAYPFQYYLDDIWTFSCLFLHCRKFKEIFGLTPSQYRKLK